MGFQPDCSAPDDGEGRRGVSDSPDTNFLREEEDKGFSKICVRTEGKPGDVTIQVYPVDGRHERGA